MLTSCPDTMMLHVSPLSGERSGGWTLKWLKFKWKKVSPKLLNLTEITWKLLVIYHKQTRGSGPQIEFYTRKTKFAFYTEFYTCYKGMLGVIRIKWRLGWLLGLWVANGLGDSSFLDCAYWNRAKKGDDKRAKSDFQHSFIRSNIYFMMKYIFS